MQALTNLTNLFNNKIFRIPDYQRGYAWQSKQLVDFWEDIINLDDKKKHYTGVITLEEIHQSNYESEHWIDDKWIIEKKKYSAYYIVDGQQRITTSIILIQVIIEEALSDIKDKSDSTQKKYICDTDVNDILKKYILVESPDKINNSYILGYAKDHPSYEYLKTKIFKMTSLKDQGTETVYTKNLLNAKVFFKENLKIYIKGKDKQEAIDSIFSKLTNNLLFNEYYIADDLDVFMAFESMNNRGKQLSALELLKNRLIYLSTLFDVENDKKKIIRRAITDAWKNVYSQLGNNRLKPLSDNDFLRAHWTMYFKYSRSSGKDYIDDLLKNQFSAKNVKKTYIEAKPISSIEEVTDDVHNDKEASINKASKVRLSSVSITDIKKYCISLSKASKIWYQTYNPQDHHFSKEESLWLDRLNRIGIGYFRPLIISSFANSAITKEQRIRMFKAIERYIFVVFRMSQQRGDYGSSEFYNACRDLYYDKNSFESIITLISDKMKIALNDDKSLNGTRFYDLIHAKFTLGKKQGFYDWGAIRYFLFEYEQHLSEKAKTDTQKIDWVFFQSSYKDSIEHILPQTLTKDCWKKNFGKYSKSQLNCLTNTLGNLLALSQAKNAILKNDCFKNKRADKNAERGYFNGSYSENELAEKNDKWTPKTIKQRGLDLLSFMEDRWDVKLGSDREKLKLLHVDFK